MVRSYLHFQGTFQDPHLLIVGRSSKPTVVSDERVRRKDNLNKFDRRSKSRRREVSAQVTGFRVTPDTLFGAARDGPGIHFVPFREQSGQRHPKGCGELVEDICCRTTLAAFDERDHRTANARPGRQFI
jgi:hypothetical protein